MSPNDEKNLLGEVLDGKTHVGLLMINAPLFALEAHKRIVQRIHDVWERGEAVDRVTVANELLRHGELESVGGISYLVSLSDEPPDFNWQTGMPLK